jgi:hypothetical protein
MVRPGAWRRTSLPHQPSAPSWGPPIRTTRCWTAHAATRSTSPPSQLPPPARYFWSLTVYDKNFFLVPHPIHRYEISSHTAGLRYNPDGSLDIYLQSDNPAGHASNWLPAPTAGQFQVTFRLYGPEPAALGRTYVYPPSERTS